MKSIFSLAFKDLKLLRRDRFALFWVIAFPLIYGLFFGSIFSGSGEGVRNAMPVIVVDNDKSEASAAFIQHLSSSEALKVTNSDDEIQARDLVRRGKVVASIIIDEGYGSNLTSIFNGSPPVQIVVDPSRSAEKAMLTGLMQEAMYRSVLDQFSDPETAKARATASEEGIIKDENLNPLQKGVMLTFMKSVESFLGSVDPELYKQALSPRDDSVETIEVETENEGPSSFEVSFPQAMMWGVIGCAAAFAVSMVQERLRGTFLRLRVSPLSRGQILAGKGLACFLAIVSVLLLMLIVGNLFFGVRLQNPAGLTLAVISTGICFTGIMMLVSVAGKTEQAVAGAGWGAFLIMAMLGGGMIPIMFMPSWMYKLSHLSPVQWGISAIQDATWRNSDFPELIIPCVLLIGAGIICYVLGVRIFSLSDR